VDTEFAGGVVVDVEYFTAGGVDETVGVDCEVFGVFLDEGAVICVEFVYGIDEY
jgi:hypothetical protein